MLRHSLIHPFRVRASDITSIYGSTLHIQCYVAGSLEAKGYTNDYRWLKPGQSARARSECVVEDSGEEERGPVSVFLAGAWLGSLFTRLSLIKKILTQIHFGIGLIIFAIILFIVPPNTQPYVQPRINLDNVHISRDFEYRTACIARANVSKHFINLPPKTQNTGS